MREEGIIERRRGRGTFVVRQAPIDVYGVSGVGHDVAQLGRASYETLFHGECKLPPALTRLFGAAPQDPVVLVQRLSLVGTQPLCVWDNYIGGSYVETAREVLKLGVSDELLEDVLGLTDATVDLHLEAGLADASVAELLDVNVGQPLLRYERVVKDANDRVAIIGFGYSRGAPSYASVPFNSPI
jgi:GntR family transcriptional regulator